jgi:hypothetical protein
MSIIVETGTASATSEAYASVAFCDTYHANIGNTLWATLQTTEKEQALRRAANFMCQSFRLQWKGSRVNSTQALDWPRYDVEIPDLGVYNVLMPDMVPVTVQQANAELALIGAAGELNPNATQGVISKTVGPLKIVYDSNSPTGKKYTAVNDMLRPFLQSGSGASMKLRRV